MEFTHIPNLNTTVSRIGLGTWSIGGWMWGGTDEDQAIETILHALDHGTPFSLKMNRRTVQGESG